MQTTYSSTAKKQWTAPSITAVRSASTAETGKLLNLTEILVVSGPAS